jgi:hypothetical protein
LKKKDTGTGYVRYRTLEIQLSAEDDEFLLLAFLLLAVEVVRPEHRDNQTLIKMEFNRFFSVPVLHLTLLYLPPNVVDTDPDVFEPP